MNAIPMRIGVDVIKSVLGLSSLILGYKSQEGWWSSDLLGQS